MLSNLQLRQIQEVKGETYNQLSELITQDSESKIFRLQSYLLNSEDAPNKISRPLLILFMEQVSAHEKNAMLSDIN